MAFFETLQEYLKNRTPVLRNGELVEMVPREEEVEPMVDIDDIEFKGYPDPWNT